MEAGQQLDPDRMLALSYVRPSRRLGLEALWRLDAALGAVLARGREPLISQIKLAWWRDALRDLDRGKVPGEPVLQSLAAHVVPSGISGADLAEMEEGWAALLHQGALGQAELSAYARARGALLFRYSAILLDSVFTAEIELSGEGWALVDLARHSNPIDAEAALGEAVRRLAHARPWPQKLRPIGMLVTLARRDVKRGLDQLEPQGAPRRMFRMLRHRITGI